MFAFVYNFISKLIILSEHKFCQYVVMENSADAPCRRIFWGGKNALFEDNKVLVHLILDKESCFDN